MGQPFRCRSFRTSLAATDEAVRDRKKNAIAVDASPPNSMLAPPAVFPRQPETWGFYSRDFCCCLKELAEAGGARPGLAIRGESSSGSRTAASCWSTLLPDSSIWLPCDAYVRPDHSATHGCLLQAAAFGPSTWIPRGCLLMLLMNRSGQDGKRHCAAVYCKSPSLMIHDKLDHYLPTTCAMWIEHKESNNASLPHATLRGPCVRHRVCWSLRPVNSTRSEALRPRGFLQLSSPLRPRNLPEISSAIAFG